MFQTKVHEIPQATRTSKGKAIQNFLELASRRECERHRELFERKNEAANKYLMMVTKQGNIKKTPLKDFENIRRNGIIAMKLKGKGAERSIEVGEAYERR